MRRHFFAQTVFDLKEIAVAYTAAVETSNSDSFDTFELALAGRGEQLEGYLPDLDLDLTKKRLDRIVAVAAVANRQPMQHKPLADKDT